MSPNFSPMQDPGSYAQIALPLPPVSWESEDGGTFTYQIPAELYDQARVGSRVLVPFGRRRAIGVLVGWTEHAPEGVAIRPVLDILDSTPAFSEELLRLTRWVASYYLCSWGEALRAALPGAFELKASYRVYPLPTAADPKLSVRLRRILEWVRTSPGIRYQTLSRRGIRLSELLHLAELGLVHLEGHSRSAEPELLRETFLRPAPEAHSESVLASLERRAPARARLLRWLLEEQRPVSTTELLRRTGISRSTLRALQASGLVQIEHRLIWRQPRYESEESPDPVALTEAQRRALGAITEALQRRCHRTFLLHGVTGSGKTQVYLEAIAAVLQQGGSAIVLVPEIVLTPQIVGRFQRRFGSLVAVLHSRLSEGERADAYRGIRSGLFRVVIGPRSAVFAPVQHLRLIVVDEEHEPSYKQFDPAPRYHARDVAIQRAALLDAVCVLGSATPSLESYHNARTGKFTLLEMPERIEAARLPEVRLVDLRRHPRRGSLSAPLLRALQERLKRGEQIILLQNRRGYAPVLECQDCGWTPACPSCAVTLTYHKSHRQLRCHYCGHAQRAPDLCTRCGSIALNPLGIGTQRVEEDLHTLLPEARVIRMDLDTTTRKNAHQELLRRFARGEADVLLGTQMVAKGLDFPRVTLVGVINADTSLAFPDFRSAERTFQLITQVAGRAGRRDLPGEVIIQTRNPEHYSLRLAAEHDYPAFFRQEYAQRRALGYPPSGRLVRAEFQHPQEGRAQRAALLFADRIREANTGAMVLGPEATLVARVKGQYRFHVLIKFPPALRVRLMAVIRSALQEFAEKHGAVRLILDVDPLGGC